MPTANNSTAPKVRRSFVWRLLKWTLYAGGFFAIVLVSILIWLVLRDRSAAAQVQARIDQLKAEGLPYDNASLAEYYARETDDRDVERWLAALKLVKSDLFLQSTRDIGPWKEDAWEPVLSTAEPWPDEARTAQFLEKWSELRDEVRQLALRDRKVRLPIVFDSILTDVSWAQEVRQLSRLFWVEAHVAIRNRQSAATRDAILTLFGCARAVEGEPLLLSQLMSTALESVATEQLRYALAADALDPDDLKLVQARLERRPGLDALWKATWYGERGGALPLFTQQREYLGKIHGSDTGFEFPLRSHDALALLNVFDRALHLPTDDFDELYAESHHLVNQLDEEFRSRNWLEQFDTMFSSLLMPAIASTGEVFIRREMLARLALLGIGVRLYEDEHGTLPDTLDQLSEVGLDLSKLTPMGDKPFGYRKEDGRAVLWGFQVRLEQSTPAEPPQVPDGPDDESTPADWDAWENRHWVWTFPKR